MSGSLPFVAAAPAEPAARITLAATTIEDGRAMLAALSQLLEVASVVRVEVTGRPAAAQAGQIRPVALAAE